MQMLATRQFVNKQTEHKSLIAASSIFSLTMIDLIRFGSWCCCCIVMLKKTTKWSTNIAYYHSKTHSDTDFNNLFNLTSAQLKLTNRPASFLKCVTAECILDYMELLSEKSIGHFVHQVSTIFQTLAVAWKEVQVRRAYCKCQRMVKCKCNQQRRVHHHHHHHHRLCRLLLMQVIIKRMNRCRQID